MDPVAPCLVFPLMRGGSFADRLQPAGEKLEHLQRLGLPSPLKPLTWRQKLRALGQVTLRCDVAVVRLLDTPWFT